MIRIKRYIVTGFVIVIPIFLTLYILVASFQFIDGIMGKFLNVYLKKTLGFYIPGLGIILFLSLIIFIGFLTTRFIGHKISHRLEKWFSGLPLIDKIYPTMKQIVLFILAQEEFGFKKVVLVEYPSKGIWSLGFLTNEKFKKIEDIPDKEMVSVFVPSSPSPLTGYLIFISKGDLKSIDISVTEALKIIISGGVFKP